MNETTSQTTDNEHAQEPENEDILGEFVSTVGRPLGFILSMLSESSKHSSSSNESHGVLPFEEVCLNEQASGIYDPYGVLGDFCGKRNTPK